MLDLNSDIAMTVDEMVVLNPWQKTVADILGEYDLTTLDGLRSGLEQVYRCRPYGAFWRYFDRSEMPIDGLMADVENSERSWWGVVDAFLERCRIAGRKKRVGAKNFAHFRYLSSVMERYPDAKCIFLVREPVAMCASKLKSPGTKGRKEKHPVLAPLIHFVILVFFIVEFSRMARAFRKYERRYGLIRVRYEDLVNRPETALREICDYCEAPYEDEMLRASGKESSHTGESASGADVSRIGGGVETLRNWERGLIRLLTGRARREMGYDGSGLKIGGRDEGPGYIEGY